MSGAKLTPIQAEVLARLTDEWQPEWRIVGGIRGGRELSGTRATLNALVTKGYAELRSITYEYRLAQKEPPMPSDALAAAIAERDAAWQRYSGYKHEPSLRSLGFYEDYLLALSKVRAICPHERAEPRGYGGTPVCVVCGSAVDS